MNGVYEPGSLIPSEARLCEEFGVSRITVRQALGELVNRGMLVKHQGRGTAVSPSFQPFGPPASTGYVEDVLLFFAATEVVKLRREQRAADEEVAGELRIARGTPLVEITRWRRLAGRPFCVSKTYLDMDLAAQITDVQLAQATFIELMEQRLGSQLSGARQVLWATVADEEFAAQLSVPVGSPVFALSLTYYDLAGTPIAYTRTNFRADRYRHHVRLGRVPPVTGRSQAVDG